MSRGHLLLIEDDPQIARIVTRGLALKGLTVVVAEDGLTGAAIWQQGAFDLILLDIMLPGIDGIALCRERRRAGDATPVILLTARGEEEMYRRGLTAGANSYISKPFAYTELVNEVFRLLPTPPSPPTDGMPTERR
jgi:DNA-binding response OmpR family regulator